MLDSDWLIPDLCLIVLLRIDFKVSCNRTPEDTPLWLNARPEVAIRMVYMKALGDYTGLSTCNLASWLWPSADIIKPKSVDYFIHSSDHWLIYLMGGGTLGADNEVGGASIVCKQSRAPSTLLSVSSFRRPWSIYWVNSISKVPIIYIYRTRVNHWTRV